MQILSIVKIAVLILGAAVVVFLLYATTRPDTFSVERSTRIKASPERVFALINDLHSFHSWNPYAKKDAAMKISYSGPSAGKGARYAWESKEVGIGSMEITDAVPPSQVAINLDFVKPFEAHNKVTFTMAAEAGAATRVTWAMVGPVPYLAKVMHLLMNIDKMVGDDFEISLRDLKAQAEAH